MPERTSYEPGTFSWVDLSTSDVQAAKAFYAELFGWDYHVEETPTGPYLMALRDGKAVAGLGSQPEAQQEMGIPPSWNPYVSVTDADETAAQAAQLGGAVVVAPMDAMEAGRMAFIAAPGGEMFGVWEPKSHIGAGLVGEHGSVVWNELATRDLDGAKDFYSALFGWEITTGPVGGTDMVYSVARVGEAMAAGLMEMNDNYPPDMPPHWLTYFEVEDCEAAVATAKDSGGQVIVPPMSVEDVGTFATLQDPTGGVFSVMTSAAMPG